MATIRTSKQIEPPVTTLVVHEVNVPVNLSAIDLNLFVVFEAVYTERNLTRAAAILNITQPAVSNALARLRASLDDPLFVRSGNAMSPTPVAHNLIGPVRQAMQQLRAGIDQGAGFDPATSERAFHLAMRETAGSALLPELMGRVRTAAPRMRLQSHLVDRQDIPTELASGALDFAIEIPQLEQSELNCAPILSDRYVCVLRRDHPMARGKLTLKRFLELEHITMSSRRAGRTLIDLALNKMGEQVNTVLRIAYSEPAFHVVMGTDLALAAPHSLAKRYDVAIKELPFESPVLDSFLYWHKQMESDPANAWMRARILEAAGRHFDP